MVSLKYRIDYNILVSLNPWEWYQTLLRWKLNLFFLRNGRLTYTIWNKKQNICFTAAYYLSHRSTRENSMDFEIILKKRWNFYELGINCGIYTKHIKIARKKVKHMPKRDQISFCFIFKFGHLNKIILERTRVSRWLGQENEENVARTRIWFGLPSSLH